MSAPETVDVVCLGESMVTFLPTSSGRLADVPSFERGIGGAESNVACALAAAGHRTRWLSRVGTDGFGDHLVEAVAAYGVDTSAVQRDRLRPTGIYFRTAGERATGDGDRATPGTATAVTPEGEAVAEVVYYRAGSAASAMSPRVVPDRDLWSGRILHLSGITAALSDDCLALLGEATRRRPGRPLVSFDVNYRVNLWDERRSVAAEPAVLLDLARGADLVFVGEDEAEAAWSIRGANAIRAALPEPGVVVVKQGGAGATVFTDDGPSVFVAALAVDIAAPVGAGDAFAAGFLSATLRGLPVRRRIRHGHLMAAAALTVAGDLAVPPPRAVADRLAALDDEAWGRLRLGPGWTEAAAVGADREVCTP
ncbi:sugar kinase [Embleya scabrispora]|uniref:sugar kinase n=1 Tax=Embleya scabrispora TaxID=159449 RepID=UPI0039C85CDB